MTNVFSLHQSTKVAAVALCAAAMISTEGHAQTACAAGGCAGPTPYPNMPDIAPIGVRIDKYMDIPESAKGPQIDPAKGYRIEDLGRGLYMVSEGAYQSMFLVYETGVVVVDVPPTYAARLPAAMTKYRAESRRPETSTVCGSRNRARPEMTSTPRRSMFGGASASS